MTTAFPPPRRAVSLLFLLNGFVIGSWAPKIPEFAARLGLTESGLGMMILFFGIGSLIAMPLTGWAIARAGSRRAVRPLAALTCVVLAGLTIAPDLVTAGIAIVFAGAMIGGMDVAMNANAVAVERRMGRAIMSSCHGFWSLGGLAGAASGGMVIATAGVGGHAAIVTALAAIALAAAWRHIFDDGGAEIPAARARLRLPSSPLPWLIGAMALFSMIPEGAVLDWGALYLRDELGASLGESGFAFAAFSAAMALMRFTGDRVLDRFGAVATLRLCSVAASAGLLAAGLADSPSLAIAGFALAGIGISNMVPIAFSAAGNLTGMAPGIALSAVTFMGYSGILFAPSLIGFIAGRTGFAVIFAALPALLAVVLVLSGLARHADRVKAPAPA